MPVSIKKVPGKNCYRVSTPHGVKARCTSKRNAERQRHLLNAVDHGFKPTESLTPEGLVEALLCEGASLYFKGRHDEFIDSDISMSYSNVTTLLHLLGFDLKTEKVDVLGASMDVFDQFSGDPAELVAACERYLGSELGGYVDQGTETRQDDNIVYSGRRPGYFKDRVTQTLKAAQDAVAQGAKEFYFA